MNDVQGTLAVSASALRAERLRLDVIASNLANATTTRTAEGGPYRRRNVVFVSQAMEGDFETELQNMAEEGMRRGVAVAEVVDDPAPFRQVFEPSHPDANAEGYVSYPNVNPVAEMVDLMAATRAYEANVQAVNATRKMADAALSIGG
jgi:flagellar basal-body rod protein FlgC